MRGTSTRTNEVSTKASGSVALPFNRRAIGSRPRSQGDEAAFAALTAEPRLLMTLLVFFGVLAALPDWASPSRV